MSVPPLNIVLEQLWLNSSIWLKDACYNLIRKVQFYYVAKKKNAPGQIHWINSSSDWKLNCCHIPYMLRSI